MLLTQCQGPCGKLLPATESFESVTVEVGAGLVKHLRVCQLCYNKIMNEEMTESKLLVEG